MNSSQANIQCCFLLRGGIPLKTVDALIRTLSRFSTALQLTDRVISPCFLEADRLGATSEPTTSDEGLLRP